jgi:UDP-N-acetyl-D-glucosamine dehydrogenase
VGKAVKGSRIVVYGVAYKRDIDDVRESPALDIIHLLQKRGAEMSYVDPWIPEIRLENGMLRASEHDVVKTADCVVIVTDHKQFDYAALLRDAPLIVDTRNALKGVQSDKVFRL